VNKVGLARLGAAEMSVPGSHGSQEISSSFTLMCRCSRFVTPRVCFLGVTNDCVPLAKRSALANPQRNWQRPIWRHFRRRRPGHRRRRCATALAAIPPVTEVTSPLAALLFNYSRERSGPGAPSHKNNKKATRVEYQDILSYRRGFFFFVVVLFLKKGLASLEDRVP